MSAARSTDTKTLDGALWCRPVWFRFRSGCSAPVPSWLRAPPTSALWRLRSRLRPRASLTGRALIHYGYSPRPGSLDTLDTCDSGDCVAPEHSRCARLVEIVQCILPLTL